MKGVFPWLVRLTRRADTIDFCPALAALASPVQNIISSEYDPTRLRQNALKITLVLLLSNYHVLLSMSGSGIPNSDPDLNRGTNKMCKRIKNTVFEL
jgi:hypothetical protein